MIFFLKLRLSEKLLYKKKQEVNHLFLFKYYIYTNVIYG